MPLIDLKKYKQNENRKLSLLTAVISLLALTVAMFGDVLFSFKDFVLSTSRGDIDFQFAYWRAFGFDQLKQGNLALWNPHLFSGMPYFGGFQSALLYPLNIFYLIMPLPNAINFGIALHVFLAGVFMYLWASYRGLCLSASLLSSIIFMFCGAHFMHIYAGHLSNLCTMIWAPLLFLSIDRLSDTGSWRWCLLGMFAITMQILAGHPQYVFYTAVAAIIYTGFSLSKSGNRIGLTSGFFLMYGGAIAIAAIQILPGIQAAEESVRSDGLSFEFASTFSFPPENLMTLFIPGFFGNITDLHYWGRWYLWENSLFMSVTGFFLLVYGAIHGDKNIRRFSVSMVLMLLLLALGANTPLFTILYNWIPGFNKFRGTSKFIFHASLFLAMLVAIGFDHLVKYRNVQRGTIISIMITCIFAVIAAFSIRYSIAADNSTGFWHGIIQRVFETRQSYLPRALHNDGFVYSAGVLASNGLFVFAGICLLLLLLFFLTRFSDKAVYAIALLAIIEIFIFARSSRPTFLLSLFLSPEIKQLLTDPPDDIRMLNIRNPNIAMSAGLYDLWGYDPGVLKRYAQFMSYTQGHKPDDATQYIEFSRFHKLYKMLRGRYIIIPDGNSTQIEEIQNVMPRLQLIQDWVVKTERDQIFAAMEDAGFDPAQKVVLEAPPLPAPIKSEERGVATVVDSSTDHLTIEAELPNPAILLITDAYSKGWRARALSGSHQKKYDIMPANYILRAIPLSRGYHHFRVEYLPIEFIIGKWISIFSVIVYVCFLGWYCLKSMAFLRS